MPCSICEDNFVKIRYIGEFCLYTNSFSRDQTENNKKWNGCFQIIEYSSKISEINGQPSWIADACAYEILWPSDKAGEVIYIIFYFIFGYKGLIEIIVCKRIWKLW